jgi:hypothetical protein
MVSLTVTKAHSEFPASGAKRLMACPGSLRLTRELAERGALVDRTSVYAAEGTVAHRLAEELLAHRGDEEGQALVADGYINQPIIEAGHTVIFDEDMLDHVLTYVRYVETLEAFDYNLEFEQRVSPTLPWTITADVPPLDLFGTADCCGVSRKHGDIVVVDLKFGSGVKVEVFENPQLMYYALGVVSKLWSFLLDRKVPVELVVIQPRVAGGHEPKIFNTTAGDIIDWGNDVFRPAVERALLPNAKLDPGEWCQFCPAHAHCPELQRLAKAKTVALFDDGAFEDDPKGALAALSDRSLGDDLLLVAKLEGWVEALCEEAFRRLSNGIAVPWHKLVEKRAIRKWTDEESAINAAAAHGYDITETVALSPARAEKLAPRVDFAPFYEKKSSGLTLAHESDSRPRIHVLDSDQQKRIA